MYACVCVSYIYLTITQGCIIGKPTVMLVSSIEQPIGILLLIIINQDSSLLQLLQRLLSVKSTAAQRLQYRYSLFSTTCYRPTRPYDSQPRVACSTL